MAKKLGKVIERLLQKAVNMKKKSQHSSTVDHNSTCLLCRALDRWPGLSEWTQIQDAYWDVHHDPEKQRKQLTVKGECSLVSLSGSRMSPEKGIRIRGTRQTGKSGSQTKSSSKGHKSQPGPRDENEEGFYSSCQHGRATWKYFPFLLSLCLPSSSLLTLSAIPVNGESF